MLLVEGTSGVGKSTLLDGILRRYIRDRPPRKVRTLLHLSQAHTYGPLAQREDRGSLTAGENSQHLETIVSLLEWHVRALTAESTVKFLGLVDTLHLTQCHRPGVVVWNDVQRFDDRLARAGVRMVFLRASPEIIWQRGILPRADDSFIRVYAHQRFGVTLEQIHAYFVAEQERMQSILDKTVLPYMVLHAEADPDDNVARATDFWLG